MGNAGYPSDRLTLNPRGSELARPDAAVTIPGTELFGFDHLAVVQLTNASEVVGNVARYGPAPILVVPSGNRAAVITGLAVQMEPDSFMFRWGWWLAITRGAIQEFELQTSNAVDADIGRDYAGRLWAAYASLDSPQIIRMQVDPGSTLQIEAAVGLPVVGQPLNLYVRILGYYQDRR